MFKPAIFIAVIATISISTFLADENLKSSSQCINGDCYVSVSSSVTSLVIGGLLAIFAMFFPRIEQEAEPNLTVEVWRRLGAFYIDSATVLVITSPYMNIPILIAEANHSSGFAWNFERDFARPEDTIFLIPTIFGPFAFLYLYFYLYTKAEKQTLGQYSMSYKVCRLEGAEPKYALRVVYSYIGLCIWPYSVIMALRKPDYECWWDSSSNTQVLRVKAVNKTLQPTASGSG